MKWTKIVLLFQAIITLILGLIFMSQVLTVKSFQTQGNANTPVSEKTTIKIENIKQRYTTATYILIFIALIELVIITKFFT